MTATLLLPASVAHAQYPGGGGGGYPGGGGPPGPANWTALPTPASANSNAPVYDWTGLSVLIDLLVPPNVPDSPLYHQSFHAPGGVNYTDEPFDSPNGGIGTGGGGFLQSFLQVNGTSTYKWQWLPPNGDLTHYPAPSLYVLGKTGGAVTSFYRTATGQPVFGGASINATLADGWGWSQTLTAIPGALPSGPNPPPGRKVLGTSADGSLANTYKATLSPSLTVTMDGSGTSDKIDATCSVTDGALPIELLSPNPLTNPNLGDGTNQYVYTADTPDGYLYVPGSLQVVGGTSADALFLLANYPLWSPGDQVDLKIENPVIPNTFTHQWSVSNGVIFVNTPNNGYPGYQGNNWIYKGLPADNNDFGAHEVSLYVQGQKSQSAHLQTFFEMWAQNFPGCDSTRQVDWYHYYNLAYPSPDDDPVVAVDGTFDIHLNQYGETEFYPPANYDPSVMYGYGFSGGWVAGITIGNQAGGSTSLPVFDLGGPNGFVRYVGDLYVRGIQTYIVTCAHETAHRTLMQLGIYYPYSSSTGPPSGFVDNDGVE